jgi:arginine deiminase
MGIAINIMNKDFYIESEIGTLKKVLLHRPDLSLSCLNNQNKQSFLFDDVPELKQIVEEHDYFANKLREYDVEILYFHDLFKETLTITKAREYLINKIQATDECYITELRSKLSNLTVQDLLHTLTKGVPKSNFQGRKKNDILFFNDYLLLPLPNQIYMRDSSSWLYEGILICNMAHQARSRESLNLEIIYKFHPVFQKTKHPFWHDNEMNDNLYSIEGGDIPITLQDANTGECKI